jgi:hypothetical protein
LFYILFAQVSLIALYSSSLKLEFMFSEKMVLDLLSLLLPLKSVILYGFHS